MELQGENTLVFSSLGLFTVRDLQKAVGVNVEIEATCCMKQLRHYACCWPATLKGRRVQAADGDLAVEPKSTSGTRCVDYFFVLKVQMVLNCLKKSPCYKKITQKIEPWGISTVPSRFYSCCFSSEAVPGH